MQATLGSILVNSLLPEPLRDYQRVWDKKTTQKVLDILAKEYPDQYKDVVAQLHDVGGMSAYLSGHTVGLKDLVGPSMTRQETLLLRSAMDKIQAGPGKLRDRQDQIIGMLDELTGKQEGKTLDALTQSDNPLAHEVNAGARGNKTQLNSMVGSSILMLDQNDNPTPVPVTRSYAQGLSPAEYWAASYGTRRGAIATKAGTAQAGFLSKQLALASHRLVASDSPLREGLGLPVEADDEDNVGAVLAKDVGRFKAGQIITSAMLKSWPAGTKKILVRSPISDISEDGGVPQQALGLRERGEFPAVGEQVGIPAIQTATERLSQQTLNTKHSGGAGSIRRGGFDLINQLLQVPEVFPSGAAHAAHDGVVDSIQDAPQGGWYVHVGDAKHYVAPDQKVTVQRGQEVEAGDVLSNGLPNPAALVLHKGVGEGRKRFMELMRDVFRDSKIDTNRRNIELLARSVINHVEITDESPAIPGALPGDILEYDRVAHAYQPRDGALKVRTASAKGGYLEQPVLHYSIGTRVTPSVTKTLKEHDVKDVTIHKDPPPFVPHMERAMTNLLHSPDWSIRLGSFYISKGMQDAVHRGGSADLNSTSYIPRLTFGRPLAEDE